MLDYNHEQKQSTDQNRVTTLDSAKINDTTIIKSNQNFRIVEDSGAAFADCFGTLPHGGSQFFCQQKRVEVAVLWKEDTVSLTPGCNPQFLHTKHDIYSASKAAFTLNQAL